MNLSKHEKGEKNRLKSYKEYKISEKRQKEVICCKNTKKLRKGEK
jgi:hypothetical protein